MFEKEAEEYQIRKHHQRLYGHKPVVMKELNTTFKDGAEFGYNKANEEMQVQLAISEHDREHNDYELAEAYKKIESLEAQIEKMKCCGNCSKNGHIRVAEEMQGKLCGKNKDKWELRR